MNNQRSLRDACAALVLVAVLASVCNRGEDSSGKTRNPPGAAARDTVSTLALNEDGLGPIQVGMTLDDAVNMGILNENPSMRPECDFVFPAVGAGIPDGVSVMVVRGKIARIDVDTG